MRTMRRRSVIRVLYRTAACGTVLTILFSFLDLFRSSGKHHKNPGIPPVLTPTRFHGAVPIVSRAKLAETEAVQIYLNRVSDIVEHPHHDDETLQDDWILSPNPNSPPRVHDIPDSKASARRGRERNPFTRMHTDTEADRVLCGGTGYQSTHPSPCRLLLIANIGEALPNAQMHLKDIALLAYTLNRTLVLPNVSKGKVGSCLREPFGFYFEEDSLRRVGGLELKRGVNFEVFQEWVDVRPTQPLVRIISVESYASAKQRGVESPNMPPQGVLTMQLLNDDDSFSAKHQHCLQIRVPRLKFSDSRKPILIRPLLPTKDISSTLFAKDLVNALSRESSIETLILNWDLRSPIFSQAELATGHLPDNTASLPNNDIHLTPAFKWISLARTIAESLKPFIFVRWRIKRGASPIECATSLVQRLEERLNGLNSDINSTAHSAYFAANSPFTSHPHLHDHGSFLSEQDTASDLIRRAFSVDADGPLQNVRLVGLTDMLILLGETSITDPGVYAILEKEIMVHGETLVLEHGDCTKKSFAETENQRKTRTKSN